MFQVLARPSSGGVYPGSSRPLHLPLHASAHHDSKSLPPLSGFRVSAGPLQFRREEHRDRRASPPWFQSGLLTLSSARARIRSTRRKTFRIHHFLVKYEGGIEGDRLRIAPGADAAT